jgi:beta-galactosidase
MVKLLLNKYILGKAYQIVLDADRKTITANGEDISFVTVSVVDKMEFLAYSDKPINFRLPERVPRQLAVTTSLEMFHKDTMKLLAES